MWSRPGCCRETLSTLFCQDHGWWICRDHRELLQCGQQVVSDPLPGMQPTLPMQGVPQWSPAEFREMAQPCGERLWIGCLVGAGLNFLWCAPLLMAISAGLKPGSSLERSAVLFAWALAIGFCQCGGVVLWRWYSARGIRCPACRRNLVDFYRLVISCRRCYHCGADGVGATRRRSERIEQECRRGRMLSRLGCAVFSRALLHLRRFRSVSRRAKTAAVAAVGPVTDHFQRQFEESTANRKPFRSGTWREGCDKMAEAADNILDRDVSESMARGLIVGAVIARLRRTSARRLRRARK